MKIVTKIIFSIIMINCAIISQTQDDEFNIFLQGFKDAIKSNNINDISRFMNFPFLSEYGLQVDRISEDNFINNTKYHSILPDFEILSNSKFNKAVDKKIKNDIIRIDFFTENGVYIIKYLVISEEEGADGEFHFSKESGEYKYSKLLSSALNGPPYEGK